MVLVAEAASDGHNTHKFHIDRPVPIDVLTKCLSMAQYTSSNNNLQPWRITICTGRTLSQLRNSLVSAFESQIPLHKPEISEQFMHLQQNNRRPGFHITHDDTEAHSKAITESLRSYGAPCLAIASIEKTSDAADIVSVGMYLQTLIILLSEQGLDIIPQASIAGYPELVRRELEISEGTTILCGLAIGYPDKASSLNASRKMPRSPWQDNVKFLS